RRGRWPASASASAWRFNTRTTSTTPITLHWRPPRATGCRRWSPRPRPRWRRSARARRGSRPARRRCSVGDRAALDRRAPVLPWPGVMPFDENTRMAEVPLAPSGGKRDRAYLVVLAGSSVGEMFKIDAEVTIIGRGQKAQIRLLDDGISREHARLVQRS